MSPRRDESLKNGTGSERRDNPIGCSRCREVPVPFFQRAAGGRHAMTLVELLLALTMMTFIIGALAVLASGVQIAANYSDGHGTAVQHGRVVLERIARKVQEAYAIETLPGAIMIDTQLGGYDYPNTLVVWHPNGAPANAAGPPLIRELVVYAPNPSSPNELWEVTDANNSMPLDLSSTTATQMAITAVLNNNTSKKTILTDLVRTATTATLAIGGPPLGGPVSGGPFGGSTTISNSQQAAVRFVLATTPSAADWTSYKNGTIAWNNLPWPQDLYGATMGMRQVWIRAELQLNAGPIGGIAGNGQDVVPFLGSATLYYEMHQ